jgi:hypothetical protein
MSVQKPCENGGISIAMFLIVSSLIVIILSTIDFHTGLIWDTTPRVNAEIRYIVTILSIAIMFVYMFCRQIRVEATVDIITTKKE